MTIAFGDERLPRRYWDKVQVDAVSGCWRWRGFIESNGYGRFWIDGKMQYVHRLALSLTGVEFECVDHVCKSRNCVNPEHLRPATHRENQRYKTSARGSSSRFLGVCWDKQRAKWRAVASIGDLRPDGEHKRKNLGRFTSEEEAARAYDRAVRAVYGEFATLNFPEDV